MRFDLSRPAGIYGPAYNVWVESPDAGLNWTFTSSTGSLWGEAYDRDLNSKVGWVSCGLLTSAQSGGWSSSLTWDGEHLPSACNEISIAAGHTVLIDFSGAVSSTATIFGTLRASRDFSSKWTLMGGNVEVMPGGWLDYGSPAYTIPTAVTAELVLARGDYAGQHGLIVNDGGDFTVRGSTKTPYSYASASIAALDTSLAVHGSTSVAGWQPGDVIAIGPTGGTGPASVSTRTVTGIIGGAPYVISWSATEPLETARTLTAETPILVSNLTRNVLVRSSGTDTAADTAYIRSLARNATSFLLEYGEFAYIGANSGAGKYGITFDGAFAKGAVSSSTVRNGYRGILLDNSSGIGIAGNSVCYGADTGIYLNLALDSDVAGNAVFGGAAHGLKLVFAAGNDLRGNHAFSNGAQGARLENSSSNIVRSNRFYANTGGGLGVENGSDNTLAGNFTYASGANGIALIGTAAGNFVAGNDIYSAGYGLDLGAVSNNILLDNYVYSNSYGYFAQGATGNNFTGGALGYARNGANLPNSAAEVFYAPGGAAETLELKGARVNPANGVDVAGMDLSGAYLSSFNQDYDTGTVRLWGNYRAAGHSIVLDYAQQVYTSTATAPHLLRGAGHKIGVTTTNDAYTLNELITVIYQGGSQWRIEGSSSGVLDASFSCSANTTVGFSHDKVTFGLTAGPAPAVGDRLDLVTLAASGDANTQKKLLFGPSAAAFNHGRSKLEIAPDGGLVLRGKNDGTAYTMVDWLNASATYYSLVSSGSFSAGHSSFTNLDQDGLRLSGGALVALSTVTFDYLGFSSGSNSYLTIKDLTGDLVFHNVEFGMSRPAGVYSPYNIWVVEPAVGLNLVMRKARQSLGSLWGSGFEHDIDSVVVWSDDFPPTAGCATGVTVRKDGTGYYDTIQDAVDSLDRSLTGNACVLIRDAGTYAEQVELRPILRCCPPCLRSARCPAPRPLSSYLATACP